MEPLVQIWWHDPEVTMRGKATTYLVSHGIEKARLLLLDTCARERDWMLRCSVFSAVAEHTYARPERFGDLDEAKPTRARVLSRKL